MVSNSSKHWVIFLFILVPVALIFNSTYLSPGCHVVAQPKKECMEFHLLVAIQSWKGYCPQLQCGKDPLKCRWDPWHVPDIPCKQPAFIRKLIQIHPADSKLKTSTVALTMQNRVYNWYMGKLIPCITREVTIGWDLGEFSLWWQPPLYQKWKHN